MNMAQFDTDFQQITSGILDEIAQVFQNVHPGQAEQLLQALLAARRVFFAGAGRSRQMLCSIAMRFMHMGLMVHVVGDVTTPAITQDDLLIVASGSGETATMLAVANKARAAGAKIALITSKEASSLGSLADLQLILPRNPAEAGLAKGGHGQIGAAVFEQALLVCGDALTILLAEALRVGDAEHQLWTRHANLE